MAQCNSAIFFSQLSEGLLRRSASLFCFWFVIIDINAIQSGQEANVLWNLINESFISEGKLCPVH